MYTTKSCSRWAQAATQLSGSSCCRRVLCSALVDSPSLWCLLRGLSHRRKGEIMGPVMKGLEGASLKANQSGANTWGAGNYRVLRRVKSSPLSPRTHCGDGVLRIVGDHYFVGFVGTITLLYNANELNRCSMLCRIHRSGGVLMLGYKLQTTEGL